MDINEFGHKNKNKFSPKYHHVRAHHVSGYIRKDGTYVSAYFRDGDGDKNTMSFNGYYSLNPGQKAILKIIKNK